MANPTQFTETVVASGDEKKVGDVFPPFVSKKNFKKIFGQEIFSFGSDIQVLVDSYTDSYNRRLLPPNLYRRTIMSIIKNGKSFLDGLFDYETQGKLTDVWSRGKDTLTTVYDVINVLPGAVYYGRILLAIIDLANIIAYIVKHGFDALTASLSVAFVGHHAAFGAALIWKGVSFAKKAFTDRIVAQSDDFEPKFVYTANDSRSIVSKIWRLMRYYVGCGPQMTDFEVTREASSLRTHFGLFCDTTRVIGICQGFFEKMTNFLSGASETEEAMMASVDVAMSQLNTMCQPDLEENMLRDPSIAPRLEILKDQVSSIERVSFRNKYPIVIQNKIRDLVARMTIAYGVINTCRMNSKPRHRPVMLHFHGKPGVGKTVLVDTLCVMLYREVNKAVPTVASDCQFSRNVNDEFWTGYRGQLSCTFSDPYQDSRIDVKTDIAKDFFNIGESADFKLNMADMAGKMGTFFTSRFVFVTANGGIQSCVGDAKLQNLAAYKRRFIEVAVNRDITKTGLESYSFNIGYGDDDYDKIKYPHSFDDVWKMMFRDYAKYEAEHLMLTKFAKEVTLPKTQMMSNDPDAGPVADSKELVLENDIPVDSSDVTDSDDSITEFSDKIPVPSTAETIPSVPSNADLIMKQVKELAEISGNAAKTFVKSVPDFRKKFVENYSDVVDQFKLPKQSPRYSEDDVHQFDAISVSIYETQPVVKIVLTKAHDCLHRCLLLIEDRFSDDPELLKITVRDGHVMVVFKRITTKHRRIWANFESDYILESYDPLRKVNVQVSHRSPRRSFFRDMFVKRNDTYAHSIYNYRHIVFRSVSKTEENIEFVDLPGFGPVDLSTLDDLKTDIFAYFPFDNEKSLSELRPLNFMGFGDQDVCIISTKTVSEALFLALQSRRPNTWYVYYEPSSSKIDRDLCNLDGGKRIRTRVLFIAPSAEHRLYSFLDAVLMSSHKESLKWGPLTTNEVYDWNRLSANFAAWIANGITITYQNVFDRKKIYGFIYFRLTSEPTERMWQNYFWHRSLNTDIPAHMMALYIESRKEALTTLKVVVAVLAGMTAVGVAASFYFANRNSRSITVPVHEHYPVNPQGSNYSDITPNHKAARAVVPAKKTEFKKIEVQMGTYDTQVSAVYRSLHKLVWLDGNMVPIFNIYGINFIDNYYILPKHFLITGPRRRFYLEIYDPIIGKVKHCFPVACLNVFQSPDRDLAILQINHKTFPKGRDLRYLFYSKNHHDYLNAGVTIMPTFSSERVFIASGEGFKGGMVQYHHDKSDTPFVIETSFQFQYPTVQGMCGCPYIFNVKGEWKIIALHVAGHRGKTGFGSFVDRESIDGFLNTNRVESQGSSGDDYFRTLGFELVPEGKALAVIPPNVSVRGFVPPNKANNLNRKSSLVKTSFFNQVFEDYVEDYKIVKFFPFTGKDGKIFDPLQIAVDKFAERPRCWSSEEEDIYRKFSRDYFDELPLGPTGCVTPDKFIYNTDGAGLPAMNVMKSAGYTRYFEEQKRSRLPGKWFYLLCTICGGKQCNCEDRVLGPDKPLVEMLKHIEDECDAGRKPVFMFADCQKDETRESSRVDAGKTRLFSAGPIDAYAAMRKYFGEFISMYNTNFMKTATCVGLNPHSKDWTFLGKKLFPNKDWLGHDSDVSNWDASLFWFVCNCMIDDILIWYENSYRTAIRKGVPVESEAEFARNQRRRYYIFQGVSCASHLLGAQVYEVESKNPSGCFITTPFNCCINVPLNRTIAVIWSRTDPLSPVPNVDVFNYSRYFREAVQGDDAVQTTCLKEYTNDKRCVISTRLGFTMTSADHGAEVDMGLKTPENVRLCKRSFRYEEGIFYAPFEKENIYRIMSFRNRRLDDQSHFVAVLPAVTMEAFHLGRDFFEDTRRQLITARNQFFPDRGIKVPTFEDCFKQFHEGTFEYTCCEMQMGFGPKDARDKPRVNKEEKKVFKNPATSGSAHVQRMSRLKGAYDSGTGHIDVANVSNPNRHKEDVIAEANRIAAEQVKARKQAEKEKYESRKALIEKRNPVPIDEGIMVKNRTIRSMPPVEEEEVPILLPKDDNKFKLAPTSPAVKKEVPTNIRSTNMTFGEMKTKPRTTPLTTKPVQAPQHFAKASAAPKPPSRVVPPMPTNLQIDTMPKLHEKPSISEEKFIGPMPIKTIKKTKNISVKVQIPDPKVDGMSEPRKLVRKYVNTNARTSGARIPPAPKFTPVKSLNDPNVHVKFKNKNSDAMIQLLTRHFNISVNKLTEYAANVKKTYGTKLDYRTDDILHAKNYHRAKTAFMELARIGAIVSYRESYRAFSDVIPWPHQLLQVTFNDNEVKTFVGWDIDPKNGSKLAFFSAYKYYNAKMDALKPVYDAQMQMETDVTGVMPVAEVQRTTMFKENLPTTETKPESVQTSLWKQVDPYEDQTPTHLLTRQFQLDPITWSSVTAFGTTIAVFRFPAIMDLPVLQPLFKKFRYLASAIEIEFRANANMMQYGMLLFEFYPNWNQSSTHFPSRDTIGYSTNQMFPYFPTINNVVKIRIPMATPLAGLLTSQIANATTGGIMGTIIVSVLDPLKKADSVATQTITIVPFVRFIDITGRAFQTQSEPAENAAKSSNTSASAINDGMGVVNSAISRFQQPETAIDSVASLAKLAMGVARLIGYSKGSSLEANVPFVPNPLSNVENHGLEYGRVFGMSPDALLSNDALTTFDQAIDYNQFDNYKLLPSLKFRNVWLSTSTPLTTFFRVPLEVFDSSTTEWSAMDLLAGLHTFWRGGHKFRIYAVCNKFTTARVRVFWMPASGMTVPTGITAGDYINTVYNIDSATVIEFTVPYNTAYFCSNTRANNTTTGQTVSTAQTRNGELIIQLLTEIQVQGNNTQELTLIGFQSCAEDMVFSRPAHAPRHPTYVAEIDAVVDGEAQMGTPQADEIRSTFRRTFPPLFKHEHIVLDRVTLSDCSSSFTEYWSAPYLVQRQSIATGTSTVFINFKDFMFGSSSPFSWMFAAFQNHRGSMRCKVVPRTNCDDVRFRARPVVGNMVNSSLYGDHVGFCYGDYVTRQALEFKVPYYSNYLFINEGFDGFVSNSDFGAEIEFIHDGTNSTNTVFDIFLSVGEDFVPATPITLPVGTLN